jgi:CRISPR type I-E-associated protein CasA/Cse1
MTAAHTSLRFNALTDPWLPLLGADGTRQWASPVEVLCGEKVGVDLDYPRDDFRVYARLLLSALVQAVMPAKDKGELLRRLEEPLSRAAIEASIMPVVADFELFGTRPFLQIVPNAAGAKSPGAARFVFPPPDLFQPSVLVDAVSLPIALVTIFGEQAYAGGAGRGYGAGPGGQPGALTLIEAGDVRRSAWANTLTLEGAARLYAPDPKQPWSNTPVTDKLRGQIGLVEGLLFQPRGVWLVPKGTGVCSFTGETAELVCLSPLVSKSSPRKGGNDDLWQHPCLNLPHFRGHASGGIHACNPDELHRRIPF